MGFWFLFMCIMYLRMYVSGIRGMFIGACIRQRHVCISRHISDIGMYVSLDMYQTEACMYLSTCIRQRHVSRACMYQYQYMSEAPQHGAARHSTATRNISDLWRPCSHHHQLRLSWMDCLGVDWHPCASKQARIVRIALCEQWGSPRSL